MRTPRGFSLTELLLLLAILGTILALSSGYLNPDRQAVNQAASSLAAQVTRARLEAIRQNTFVGIQFTAQGYVVFADRNRNNTPDENEILQAVTFGQGEWARVRLSQVEGGSLFLFDPRGIPTAFLSLEVTLSNARGTYTKTVRISGQGGAKIL